MPRVGFVYRDGIQLKLDGVSFRHIGVNTPGIAYYGAGPLPASRADQEVFLDNARCMGARVVRLFAGHRDLSHDRAVNLLSDFLDRALNQYDIRALVSFTDFYINYHHPPGDDGYYQVDANGFTVLSPSWFGGGFRDNYLPWVLTVVSRLSDHPGVFAWELGNELKNLPNPQVYVDFAQQMHTEIRARDPDHLITPGVASVANADLSWAQARQLYSGMDIVQVHVYGADHADNDMALARDMGLAHIVGEAGYPPNNRVADLQWDLQDWFNTLGTQGYYQWGFMPTSYDNGDGDRIFGMDRIFHGDFEDLFRVYTAFTGADCEPIPPPPPQGASLLPLVIGLGIGAMSVYLLSRIGQGGE